MVDLNEIKDQVVAIHLAKMEGKLEALKTSNDGIGKQLDYVMQELREMVKLSNKLPDHEDAVKKIWQEIEERDRLWHDRLQAANMETGQVRDKVNKIFWFGAGFSSIAGALLAVVVWLVLAELDQSKQLADKIRNIELYLVGDKSESFRVE